MSDIEATSKLYLELANLLPMSVKSSRELKLIKIFREFAHDVKNLRDAQKQYFKTRDSGVLQHCKLIEADLDAHIEKILIDAEHPWCEQ